MGSHRALLWGHMQCYGSAWVHLTCRLLADMTICWVRNSGEDICCCVCLHLAVGVGWCKGFKGGGTGPGGRVGWMRRNRSGAVTFECAFMHAHR